MATSNKRSAQFDKDAEDDHGKDSETKKLKTDSAVNDVSPKFIDENVQKKKMCPYGEGCYRQKNPVHIAEYEHGCKILKENIFFIK